MPTFFVTFLSMSAADTVEYEAADLQALVYQLLREWVQSDIELLGVFAFLRDNDIVFRHNNITLEHRTGAMTDEDDDFIRDGDIIEGDDSEGVDQVGGVLVAAMNAVKSIVEGVPDKLQDFIEAVAASVRISDTDPTLEEVD